jgi:hypothetical protein
MSPIVSPRSRGGSRRPALRVLGPDELREPPAGVLDVSEPRRPELRLLADGGRESASHFAPVLLAGADACGRAILRAELGRTLPPRTRWVEAHDVAEALERAAYSRMVILAGDLDDVDAESLMRMLGRRHPELPVISVDAPLPATTAAAGGCG